MMAVANKALKCRLRTIHENDQTYFLRWYCENKKLFSYIYLWSHRKQKLTSKSESEFPKRKQVKNVSFRIVKQN